jgi:hypothetical protein
MLAYSKEAQSQKKYLKIYVMTIWYQKTFSLESNWSCKILVTIVPQLTLPIMVLLQQCFFNNSSVAHANKI